MISDTADGGGVTDGGGGGGVCGDSTCDPGETTTNCPLDCKTGGRSVACLNQFCLSSVVSCGGDPSCAKFLQCAAGCTDAKCVDGC